MFCTTMYEFPYICQLSRGKGENFERGGGGGGGEGRKRWRAVTQVAFRDGEEGWIGWGVGNGGGLPVVDGADSSRQTIIRCIVWPILLSPLLLPLRANLEEEMSKKISHYTKSRREDVDPLMSWSGRGESSYFFVLLCWAF